MIAATFFIFLNLLLFTLSSLIIVRMIASWFIPPENRFVAVLADLTEPVISPLRRIIPQGTGFDFAPLVALLLIDALRYALFYL